MRECFELSDRRCNDMVPRPARFTRLNKFDINTNVMEVVLNFCIVDHSFHR